MDTTAPGASRWSPETLAVVAGRPPHQPDAPLSVPVVLSSTFVGGGDVGYGRYGNPTWTALEDVVGALEGGRALAYASGMAAVTAALDGVPLGGAVVVPRHAYQGTLLLLRHEAARGALTVRPVDVADTDGVVAAMDGAALLWVESPTNPALEVADLPALCAAARARGVRIVVDNTFATPLAQRPLDSGADVVVHSVTKFLAGHSDVLLGAAVARDDATYDRLLTHRSRAGAVPAPMDCYLALRGIRTLPLRLARATASAGVLAERLRGHPAVRAVRYPGLPDDPGHARAAAQMRGFGAVLGIELPDAARADAVVAALRLWVHATSLGGVESLVERRRRWATESPTIPPGYLRLAVGLEDAEDLWADLAQALAQ